MEALRKTMWNWEMDRGFGISSVLLAELLDRNIFHICINWHYTWHKYYLHAGSLFCICFCNLSEYCLFYHCSVPKCRILCSFSNFVIGFLCCVLCIKFPFPYLSSCTVILVWNKILNFIKGYSILLSLSK